ncbi:hypothetical protein HX878_20995 [Pseudomonas veronii]|uniref:hypothetical protein n=1 Tax=Pseudomonas veronii TaxID=76761 RepID=UPI0015A40B10|nr:hypothetical protein [Pseudomonas veronii]NWD57209.1 hypothetical protein [Pseudomonas veronii]
MAKTHESEHEQSEVIEVDRKPPPKKKSKVVAVAKFVIATEAWKKHARMLKYRASFPLLREVVKNGTRANKVLIPTEVIDDVYIAKSIIGHRMIMWSSVASLCYFLTIFSKGLAVAIKFHSPLNMWLLSSVPLIIFVSFRIALSYKVLGAFLAERNQRLSDSEGSRLERPVNEVA